MESLRGRPEADVTFCRGSHTWRASESPGELAEAACQAPARVPDLVDLERGPESRHYFPGDAALLLGGHRAPLQRRCCGAPPRFPFQTAALRVSPGTALARSKGVPPPSLPALVWGPHRPTSTRGSCVGEITSRRQTRKQLYEEMSVDGSLRCTWKRAELGENSLSCSRAQSHAASKSLPGRILLV